jgi:hypothetical protein
VIRLNAAYEFLLSLVSNDFHFSRERGACGRGDTFAEIGFSL